MESIIELKIDSFNKKGNGIGLSPSAHQVEVPFSMPGDTVQACVYKKKRKNHAAFLRTVVTPAPNRVLARCVHFADCGGCRWQHVPYQEQLALKEAFIRNCFHDLDLDEHIFTPIVACDPPWAYRNKMEFTFSSDAAQNRYLGLIKDSSKGRVFNLTQCHLVNPWFAECAGLVRAWWEASQLDAYHAYRNTGALRTLTVREGLSTGDRMVMLTVSGNPDYALKREHIQGFVDALVPALLPLSQESQLSIFLRIQQVAKGMPTSFFEMLLYGPDHIRETLNIQPRADRPPIDMQFTISPSAFFQPNTKQAERLYSLALQLAGDVEDKVVYDLYCGTGTLGICMSKQAQKVIGIELSPEASLDARTNAKLNQCDNVTIHTGSVGDVLPTLMEKPEVILVDPPRAGLEPSAIKHLLALNAPKIVYIACNPETQAANCRELCQNAYAITAVQPVDQFPQTVHVENIVVLQKR